MLFILYSLFFILYSLFFILYSLFFILYSLFFILYFLFFILYSLFFVLYFILCFCSLFLYSFLISYFLFLISYFLFLISYFLFLISYFLFLISYFLFLIFYSILIPILSFPSPFAAKTNNLVLFLPLASPLLLLALFFSSPSLFPPLRVEKNGERLLSFFLYFFSKTVKRYFMAYSSHSPYLLAPLSSFVFLPSSFLLSPSWSFFLAVPFLL